LSIRGRIESDGDTATREVRGIPAPTFGLAGGLWNEAIDILRINLPNEEAGETENGDCVEGDLMLDDASPLIAARPISRNPRGGYKRSL
jgi:hypothetical protein